MMVPGTATADQNQKPKLIGQMDLHSEERHLRHLVIGGSIFGVVIVALVAYVLLFRNAWERGNGPRLLALKSEADALVQHKEYEKAKTKYAELFSVLGDRDLSDEELRENIAAARVSSVVNDRKVEPILAARAEAERQKQLDGSAVPAQESVAANGDNAFYDPARVPPYKTNDISPQPTRDAAIRALAEQYDESPAWVEANMGSSNDRRTIHHNLGRAKIRAGRVNDALVRTFKSSWQAEGWKYKPIEEQKKAIALMRILVDTDCPDPSDREATWEYVQRTIDSW